MDTKELEVFVFGLSDEELLIITERLLDECVNRDLADMFEEDMEEGEDD